MAKTIFEFDNYEDADDIKEIVHRKKVLCFISDVEDMLRKYWKYYDEEGQWKDKTPFDAIEKIREDYFELKEKWKVENV